MAFSWIEPLLAALALLFINPGQAAPSGFTGILCNAQPDGIHPILQTWCVEISHILLDNMAKLDIYVKNRDHIHGDHVGGFFGVLN